MAAPDHEYLQRFPSPSCTDVKNASLPQPVSVPPDQDWVGIDGDWNTVTLRIGDPPQYVQAFVSTASQQTWAVHGMACQVNKTDPQTNKTAQVSDTTCEDSRGHLFNISKSKSWDRIGFFQLWTERDLGLTGNGEYGYDTVGLGHPGEEGPTLKNTTVGTLVTPNFWLGHLGVNAKPTNFSAFTDPSPSYMTYLFQDNLIPSVSFGYTAGARYRFQKVLSSLTLGGYDASRFIPNDLTFGFAPDNERDIVVGIVGIHASGATKSDVNLLARDSFTMYIDSTVAELWLPLEICQAFEKAFGLKYDNSTGLYLVDDLTHQTLLAENASVTFSLGQKFATNTTVDITLPYAAFDQRAKPPYMGLQNESNYFPIRRGEEEKQFVLGRTFLQEAYLTVDWERQNFSVSQVSWVYGQPKNLTQIISPQYTHEHRSGGAPKSKRLPTGAIIGIAVGSGFTFAMACFGIAWLFWRKRQKRQIEKVKAEYESKTAEASKSPAERPDEPPMSPVKDVEEGTNVFPKAELPADFVRSELGTSSSNEKNGDPSTSALVMPSPPAEVDNTERQIFEMPGDFPTTQEAGGRQLSEKESMMVRERIYNGVDPTGPIEVSPSSEEAPRRLGPISPSEVQLVNGRNNAAISPITPRGPRDNVSPITPRTPRDGAFLEANDTFWQPPRQPRDGRYLEAEDTLLSPISPMESDDSTSRRRFSYE
ncbi:aspartic peptidase domain-containing protein [Clohesyomyces aquaticus]|uniref:Aspartic peptidase domain-containing protein n=1 Tax=Clohesyomyces aquaticus TaxID=1231657 RepID=A0A1Y1ZUW7_9PLEO|nr:aspartic peptidase domain-containing protein [Clohesyomyces aquaticus]